MSVDKLAAISLVALSAACAAPKGKPDPWGPVDPSHMAYLLETESERQSRHEIPVGNSYAHVFTGATTKPRGESGGFTLGLAYEYRLSEKIGVGGLLDHAFGDVDSTILAAAVYVHPFGDPLTLVAAPGVEFEDGSGHPVVRLGGSYELPLKSKITWAPALFVDVGKGADASLIAGVEFGIELD